MKERKGFTLIELLVVISIIALLMSILMPAMSRVKDQARKVMCVNNLRQWGITCSAYAQDNNYQITAEYDQAIWVYALKPYMGYSDEKTRKKEDVIFCPMASKPRNDPGGAAGPGYGLGPLSAWGKYGGDGYLSGMAGSYAINAWIYNITFRDQDGNHMLKKSWRTFNVRGANEIPLIGGCYRYAGYPEAWDNPPEFEVGAEYVGMGSFAVNRHDGYVSMVFLDGSSRHVGLKELWTLPWHKEYLADYATRTSRGPIKWPDWMKGFKDYL